MAKSKNKSSKNQSKPNKDSLKPLQIEETIEKLPPRVGANLDSLLDNFPARMVPIEVGGKKVISIEFDLDDGNWDDDWEEYYQEELIEEYQRILGTQDIQVNKTNFKKYFNYLNKNLNFPCLVSLIDDIVIDEEDYEEFNNSKKRGNVFLTMPVEGEYYNLVGFNNYIDNEYGILAEIEPKRGKRGQNKIRLTAPLAQLEVFDPDSPNYELLENYSIWLFGE